MENKNVILFSPKEGLGGIASWTKNVLSFIEKNPIEGFVHVDASVNKGNDANRSIFKRIYKGVMQTPKLYNALKLGLNQNEPIAVWRTCSGSLGFYRDILFSNLCIKYHVKSLIHIRFGRIPNLCKQKNWEYEAMCKAIDKSDKCIVIDEPSYDALCKEGFMNKLALIPNPCASDVEEIAKSNIRDKREEKYIFVGHVVKTKGVFELVKAFTQLKEVLPLEIIGPYMDEVKSELENIASCKSNGEWLSFTGPRPKDFVVNAMQEATALVLPTYTEGFPNVVLEAMACGCPVLATDVAAIPSMINWQNDNPCGICYKPQSVDEVVNAITKFRKNKEQQILYAQNGKQKVLNSYTMDVVMPMYINVINSLL